MMNNRSSAQLPQASPEALAASEALLHTIQEAIQAAGGWLPFSDYMRLALYTPGLGYYSGGASKFGGAGDFITAPELSPLFGTCLAATARDVLNAGVFEGKADILEVGAGTGELARQILSTLAQQQCLPQHYYILELSGELKQRQYQRLSQALPELIERIVWLDRLPEHFSGLILGNEVLDAMPCAQVCYHAPEWLERGVVWNKGLQWEDRPIQNPELLLQASRLPAIPGYCSEIQLQAQGFIHSLAQSLERGVILLFDYGFAEAEYYLPQRHMGTLMCHYRHHSHGEPFWQPGLCDITCHIDFSAIWRSSAAAGLALEGYLTQGAYLINTGLMEQPELQADSPSRYPMLAAVQKLIQPAEMGELFKVIAFSQKLELPDLLTGFQYGDDSARL